MDAKGLALEGERFCRAGDWRRGVASLEEALQEEINDSSTLSFIYNQLGLAYFFLGDLPRAIQSHSDDLALNTRIGNGEGESKACGSLGTAYKHAGLYEEAVSVFQRQLSLAKELGDKVPESRALYNLGNTYHAKGKHAAQGLQLDPGQYPAAVTEALSKAAAYYEINLNLVTSLGDKAAQGRACGNLGNTHYLLGNFRRAIHFHVLRRDLASAFKDKAAERRACTNLANSHVFLGEFQDAAKYYKNTLDIALETGEKAVEAQACYSLGNTYTLLKDYPKAVDYHLKHLDIARELKDKMGEARACWSLGNAYTAIGDHHIAVHYARLHHELAFEVGDLKGAAVAKQNLLDLTTMTRKKSKKNFRAVYDEHDGCQSVPVRRKLPHSASLGIAVPCNDMRGRSWSDSKQNKRMAEMKAEGRLAGRLDSQLPFKQRAFSASPRCSTKGRQPRLNGEIEADLSSSSSSSPFSSLRQLLSRPPNYEHHQQELSNGKSQDGKITDSFLDLLSKCQGDRLNHQRCTWPLQPAVSHPKSFNSGNGMAPVLDGLNDDFVNLVVRCQSNRFEDQRSALPAAPTIPSDDFFNLVSRLQSTRMEDQRSDLPL